MYQAIHRSFIFIVLALATVAMSAGSPTQASVPTYAPIPPGVAGPAISNSTGFRVQALGDGAYMLTDGNYQAMFLVSDDTVLVVDAPPTLGYSLLNGIRTVTHLPISHVVYSHAHADHIGAAYLFQGDGVEYIAHEETLAELAQVNDTNRPLPSIAFSKQLDLHVGNQTLELSYKGPNHEPGNIFIFAPSQRILMVVDIVVPGWVPYDSLMESQNIPGFIKAHDQILEYDFDYYIGGHVNKIGTRQDVLIQREYITDLRDNCVEGILLSGEPANASNPVSVQTALPPIEAANPGNAWAPFYFYFHDLVANYCANKTQEKWLGRLAAVDVEGHTNAVTMLESLRIDFGILGPFGVQGRSASKRALHRGQ